MIKVKWIVYWLALWISADIFSQNADFQWWPLVNASVAKGKFKFFFEEQIRFKNTASKFYLCYSDIGAYYTANDHLSFGPVFRPWWNFNDDGIDQVNRILFDVNIKNTTGNFEYSFRERYQGMMRTQDGVDPKEHFSRNKFELKYNGWKVKPFISTEFFISLFKTTPYFIDKSRNTLGLEMKVSEHMAFIPLLMYIKDRSALEYQDLFIIGGGYYFIY